MTKHSFWVHTLAMLMLACFPILVDGKPQVAAEADGDLACPRRRPPALDLQCLGLFSKQDLR